LFEVYGSWVIKYNVLAAGAPLVAITFDDGYADTYSVAHSYLKTKNMVATMYAISSLIDTAGYCTTANLLEMQADGWTIGNHTSDHTLLDTLTLAEQETNINACKNFLYGIGITGNHPLHLSYPGGHKDANTVTAMTNLGMLTGRLNTGSAITARPISDYYAVPTFGIINTVSLTDAKTTIDNLVFLKRCATLMFHKLVETPTEEIEWSISDFQALVDYILSKGVITVNMDELYSINTQATTIRHH
jgi:peptidoglycan/xylan/chitin deacetylase (PgdA/CDA1 family)